MSGVMASASVTVTLDYEPGAFVVQHPKRGEMCVVRQQIRWGDYPKPYVTATVRRRTKTGWHATTTTSFMPEAEDWSAREAEVYAAFRAALVVAGERVPS